MILAALLALSQPLSATPGHLAAELDARDFRDEVEEASRQQYERRIAARGRLWAKLSDGCDAGLARSAT